MSRRLAKIMAALLCAALMLPFCACAGDISAGPDSGTESQDTLQSEPEIQDADSAPESSDSEEASEAAPDGLFIPYGDERLKYTGRWQETENGGLRSYWNNPTLSFKFTGEKLALKLTGGGVFNVLIDKSSKSIVTQGGWLELEVPDGNEHTFTASGRGIELAGVLLDSGAEVTRIPDSEYYIEFIGDSISESLYSFSYNSPDLLGQDSAVYALGGIALHDKWGYYEAKNLDGWDSTMRVGMETAFFNCEMPNEKYEDLTEFRFGGRVPDALVIFLGTNDYLDDPWNCEDFAGYYTAFVSRIRGIYPDTAIYLCTALSDNLAKLRVSGIAAAVEAAAAACDNVKVVDIGSWGAEISSDGVHPTEAGYALLTEKFAEYLAAELGISYPQNAE